MIRSQMSRWLSRPRVTVLDTRTVPATFTVSNTLDAGAGSLRQAIDDANLSTVDPIDTITFNVGSGAVAIQPLSALPIITGGVVINGTSQPGFAGKPLVVLDGQLAGAGVHGIQVAAADVSIKGLVIQQFKGDGIQATATFTNLTITGCYVGTDLAGTVDLGNSGSGIAVFNASTGGSNVTIGGAAAADRNVVSGNNDNGIYLGGASGVSGVTVQNNYIGTDVTGSIDLGNNSSGLRVDSAASSVFASGNLISGNGGDGIGCSGDFNTFEDNVCGLAADGKSIINNGSSGIALFGGASDNFVGNFDPAFSNVISGNGTGVYCGNATTANNTIFGNFIGTDVTGLLPAGNTFGGVWINDAPSNLVDTNVICATKGDGVVIDGTNGQFNRVRNNLIGIGSDRMTIIGNTAGGVNHFGGANDNLIGSGPKDSAPNVISGNASFGVGLFDPGTTLNRVSGNYIGTDDQGLDLDLGNGGAGVAIDNGAAANFIFASDNGNTIAYNGGAGVSISSAAAINNRVSGNRIYANDGLGIDLSNNGVTANDDDDPDLGPNKLQNYQVLTAVLGGAITKVSGTFNSTPSTMFQLQFFSSPAADPTGFGEGREFLSAMNVTTDAQGDFTFINQVLPFAQVAPGDVITVTAIDPDGNTSEFSKAFAAAAPTAPPCLFDQTITINFGSIQRSRVTAISLAFDQVVTLPANPADAFQLKRQSDGAVVTLTVDAFDSSFQTFVSISFSGAATQSDSLADGRYTFTALASKITNANGSLDGNCDGTGGDDFVLVGAPANGLYRLFGDSDGDGDVDTSDFAAFRSAFGSANFTFDGDFDVDTSDFGQFRARFGATI